jgi:Family of unknown function (DUF6152)
MLEKDDQVTGMSTKIRLAFMVFGAVWLTAGLAAAHHSLVAEFDLDKPVVLRGVLTKVEWVNPHALIRLDARNADGRVESWDVETGGPANLKNRGLKPADFSTGTEVIIRGYAAKNGTRRAAGWIITFAARSASGPGKTTFSLGR